MCQTPIITAQTIPEGWLYWQAADAHCFAELKTSNQISCCTNVIATIAVLGVMDNANSSSYETSVNTSIFEIPRWKSFQKICYSGPSEQMLNQSNDACCEQTFKSPWKRLLQQLHVAVYMEEEQRRESILCLQFVLLSASFLWGYWVPVDTVTILFLPSWCLQLSFSHKT